MNKNTKKYSGGKKNKTRKKNDLKGVKINGRIKNAEIRGCSDTYED